MKRPDREQVVKLTDLPNIGKAMERDFRLLGVERPDQLVGRDPFALYEELCRVTGVRHDPCVLDVFMAAVHFMESGEALPWWAFTKERKARWR